MIFWINISARVMENYSMAVHYVPARKHSTEMFSQLILIILEIECREIINYFFGLPIGKIMVGRYSVL